MVARDPLPMDAQDNSTIGARFRSLRKRADLSLDQLAGAIGYKRASSLQRYDEIGHNTPLKTGLVAKLDEVLSGMGSPPITKREVWELAGVTTNARAPIAGRLSTADEDDIATGTARADRRATRVVTIEEVDVEAAAGSGVSRDLMAWEHEVTAEWQLPAAVLFHTTSSRPDHIKIIQVKGDSMVPDYLPGERVMVDTTDKVPSPPGVFVMDDGFGIVIKRMEMVPYSEPARVILKSRNEQYETREMDAQDVTINGRVLGKWQWT